MLINVSVKAGARSRKLETMPDGSLKVWTNVAPEKGKANAALCDLLARHFGVASTAVSVVSGQSSSRKLVEIRHPA